MTTRTATCRCGQLRAECQGEPVRVSVCHCLDCQKRTGSVFAAQARWSLLDRVHMKHELEDLLGRKVDLLNRRALENPRSNRRAREILAQTQLLYAE